jgi:hypothetical protein
MITGSIEGMLEYKELFIGGQWVRPHVPDLEDVIAPFSEGVVAARSAFDNGGGMKKSGLGSELGREGLDEFLNLKSIHLPRNWHGSAPAPTRD